MHPIYRTDVPSSPDRYHASYIYRTDVPLLPRVLFLYIQSTNIFNYFFRLSLIIFVYYSTKCRVFPSISYFPSWLVKIFTFYINGVLNCKCPAPGPNVKVAAVTMFCSRSTVSPGADKSLAPPGRKQARKHVRDGRYFNIGTRAVIKFLFL